MKLFHIAKDGGPDSNVTGYWLIEWKSVFSIVLLRFGRGTREAYHTHAFHAISWILNGEMVESRLRKDLDVELTTLNPSFKPLFTSKYNCHKVIGVANNTWALSFRGPWTETWLEFFRDTRKFVRLTNGRKVVEEIDV